MAYPLDEALQTLKRHTGTNVKHAGRVLERILSRLQPTVSGGLRGAIRLNEEEAQIFAFLSSYQSGGPLFDCREVLKDFARNLQEQGLLMGSEVPALSMIKPALSLFALTAMHNRIIDLGDGSEAILAISPDMYGNLAIFAFADVMPDVDGKGPTRAGAWILQTDLPVADYCEPGIAPPERVPLIGDFEMTPGLKLARLPSRILASDSRWRTSRRDERISRKSLPVSSSVTRSRTN